MLAWGMVSRSSPTVGCFRSTICNLLSDCHISLSFISRSSKSLYHVFILYLYITSSYHVFISCLHIMSSYHVFISCLHIVSLYRVFISCLHIVSLYRVFISCLHIMSLYHVFISCLHIMSSYHVFISCLYIMSSYYVFISCLHVKYHIKQLWQACLYIIISSEDKCQALSERWKDWFINSNFIFFKIAKKVFSKWKRWFEVLKSIWNKENLSREPRKPEICKKWSENP
jgi:hypothetical protein